MTIIDPNGVPLDEDLDAVGRDAVGRDAVGRDAVGRPWNRHKRDVPPADIRTIYGPLKYLERPVAELPVVKRSRWQRYDVIAVTLTRRGEREERREEWLGRARGARAALKLARSSEESGPTGWAQNQLGIFDRLRFIEIR